MGFGFDSRKSEDLFLKQRHNITSFRTVSSYTTHTFQNKENMSRCLSLDCPYYGTAYQGYKCSQCSWQGSRQLCPNVGKGSKGSDKGSESINPQRTKHLTEAEALEALGWTASDVFPSAKELEERILWMRTTRQQVPFLGSDNGVSVDLATEFIGVPASKRLSVDMALRIWNEVVCARGLPGLPFQKALVRLTLASWLLPSRDFGVGKCYCGYFDDGPTEARFVRNFVQRVPLEKMYG
jgi:hypothetical protein